MAGDSLHRFLLTAHLVTVVERWNNKPNLFTETVAAHSFLVTALSWGLAASAQLRDERLDLEEILKRALAHDLHEAITGDILSPTKQAAQLMKKAVEQLERQAGQDLIAWLPPPIQEQFAPYVIDPMDDSPEGRLVKTADLFAAFLKAWLEVQMGNQFHRGNLARIRRLLSGSPIIDVQDLLWEFEIHGDTLETEPSLPRFLRYLFELYHVKRWNNLPTLAPKSVAAHAHFVALIAWVLTACENATRTQPLPAAEILRRALMLEAPKAVTGDILYQSKTASRSMERGVQLIRNKAARELIEALPPSLQPAFEPYLQPLADEEAEQLVDDAGVIAGLLEALMEVRLGNTYFQPIFESLCRRIDSPIASTRRVLAALSDAAG